jgi:hypothetical protein
VLVAGEAAQYGRKAPIADGQDLAEDASEQGCRQK